MHRKTGDTCRCQHQNHIPTFLNLEVPRLRCGFPILSAGAELGPSECSGRRHGYSHCSDVGIAGGPSQLHKCCGIGM